MPSTASLLVLRHVVLGQQKEVHALLTAGKLACGIPTLFASSVHETSKAVTCRSCLEALHEDPADA